MELLTKIDDDYDLVSEYLLNKYLVDFMQKLAEKGVDFI